MKTKNNNLFVRILFYIVGFLIMTLGIAISVKSHMGVSPVSSIPYTITCVWGIEMGNATIIFHVVLVLLQIILLRKNFKVKNLLQIPVGIIFGKFTTMCNLLMGVFPDPTNVVVQLVMMFFSAFFIAFGIFLYVPADIMPLAGEGAMLAVAQVTRVKFSTIKICFDVSMVTISLVVCLTMIHRLGSVGLGTVIAAFLVGSLLKMITKVLGSARDRLLHHAPEKAAEDSDVLTQIMKTDVYTVNEDDTLKVAISAMIENHISGFPVVDKKGDLCGYIADGDIMNYLASEQSLFVYFSDMRQENFNEKISDLLDKKVSFLCTRNVISVDVGDSMSEVCAVLAENHLKKAPVMKDGKMVGIINISNIIKYILKVSREE